MRILVIEDDSKTRKYIVNALAESGHVAEEADNGKLGYDMAKSQTFNALIIDRMLPKLGGLEIVQRLRAENDMTPILMLSALGDSPQQVEGLRIGSDDYLSKPFSYEELLARLEAIVRRSDQVATKTTLNLADLELDLLKREVRRGEHTIDIKPTEFRILRELMESQGRVVTRTMLLERVWGYNFDPQTNIIETHISRLRKQIDEPYEKPLIHTIRGAGYRMYEPLD